MFLSGRNQVAGDRSSFTSRAVCMQLRRGYDRPDLDGFPEAQGRNAAGDHDRLLETFALHQEVAGEMLLRLGERAVPSEALPILLAHRRGARCRLKSRARSEVAALDDALRELAVVIHELLGIRRPL